MKKEIYIDCTRGLASDMLAASLLDCFADKEQILQEMQVKICNNMTLSAFSAKSYERQGLIFKAQNNDFNAAQSKCVSCAEHHHSTLNDVYDFIDATDFESEIKISAKSVYDILAQAEAEVHGAELHTVHFHEVGQKRAVAAILCVCALMSKMSADSVVFSHINVGYGKTLCAHGEVDVPAPATKVILRDVPFYNDCIAGELCTPTGAALAKYFATDFVAPDIFRMRIADNNKITHKGVGLGSRDIGIANGILIAVTEC